MGQGAVLGVIPARIGSKRLPRKPLQPLAGRPLIEWVWRRVRSFSALDAAVIATDSEEVASVCRALGAPVVLTSPAHASGTERVAEVAGRGEYREYAMVVNVQGDEPFISEGQVASAVALAVRDWDIGTVATPVRTLEAWRDPAVVKVVRREDGGALYFSRAAVPHCRDGDPPAEELASPAYLRHIGVYACRRDALARWVNHPPAELERIERLEQLRALEAGLSIGVALVDAAEAGVDTPRDVLRAEQRLRSMSHGSLPIP
ncbi:MAG: 3-deoxy-manno-octulosonate cytidylyltransferase [Gemmatimonadetes bacterium]|nr:3-deoxy-manno-octulosonate cytidylyltransferase [Gemmatimonadota bacterium]